AGDRRRLGQVERGEGLVRRDGGRDVVVAVARAARAVEASGDGRRDVRAAPGRDEGAGQVGFEQVPTLQGREVVDDRWHDVDVEPAVARARVRDLCKGGRGPRPDVVVASHEALG